MDKNLNIINPEDKDYYDGKLYMVGLYPGAGAELKTFYVYGEYEGEALESVVAYLDLSSETGLLLDMDEVEDIVYDDYGEEYNNWVLEHPESDWFEFANEYLGYIYVDATMKGASQPYYVEGNYLRIEEVNEDKEVKTEDVKEYLRQRYKTPTTNYIAKCTLTDGDKKFENEYLLLDTKDSNGMSGVDIILENNRFNSLWYNCDYGVEDLEIVAEVKTLDELIDFMKSVGVDLSGMVKDGEIEVGMSDRINQNLYRYVVDDEESDPKFFSESKKIKTEAEEKMYLDGELFNKYEKEVKLDFSNADMGILRLMYRRLDNLLMNVYDNSNADNLEENIKTILSKADVVVNDLPITNTLNEAFNLVNVVRSIVSSKLEEEFGYDFYYDNVYESKQIKTEANQYQELRDKHQKEFDEFPIGFAFSDKQFKEQMEKLGLTADDEDKVVGIGAGGFIRKDDVEKFKEMNTRHRAEEEEAIKNDTTGEGYIKDMFDYELANHEYGYTYDLTDTLDSLGLSMEDIQKDEKLKNGLRLALKRYDESKEVKTESINTDINRAKQKLINKAKKKGGIWENFGQDEVRALEDKYFDERYNNNGVWSAIRNFDNWCMNFTLSDLNENKESKTESVEPEENKKLDLKDRVKYAYENCNYSKRKDMPTVSDIMDYLGLDTYNNKLYNQISDILYDLGYDWQLESKQIKSNKEIKIENFKAAEVEENPEIKDPHFWWEDKDTFVMEFEGGVDEEGDKYWYLVEYWADEDTYHFFKQYDYDTLVLKLPEDKKEQIINMMKAKMN